jgi:hypothetical protein
MLAKISRSVYSIKRTALHGFNSMISLLQLDLATIFTFTTDLVMKIASGLHLNVRLWDRVLYLHISNAISHSFHYRYGKAIRRDHIFHGEDTI